MSHPRRSFPELAVVYTYLYQALGGKRACKLLHCDWEALRRYLVEHGVAIIPKGVRRKLPSLATSTKRLLP